MDKLKIKKLLRKKVIEPSKKEKLVKPIKTDKLGFRDEMTEWIAEKETLIKPPKAINKHKDVFG